jgi:hypothetical protein
VGRKAYRMRLVASLVGGIEVVDVVVTRIL